MKKSRARPLRNTGGRVILESNGTGKGGPVADYIYLAGKLVAEYKSATTYFVHSDNLGSTRLFTALNKSVFDSMDYLPFGEQIAGASGTSHKFTEDERDPESNLDHTLFRQYSSSLARWMHPDPAGLAAVDPSNPQSWNRYAYVLNDPLDLVDPLGLQASNPNQEGPQQQGCWVNGTLFLGASCTLIYQNLCRLIVYAVFQGTGLNACLNACPRGECVKQGKDRDRDNPPRGNHSAGNSNSPPVQRRQLTCGRWGCVDYSEPTIPSCKSVDAAADALKVIGGSAAVYRGLGLLTVASGGTDLPYTGTATALAALAGGSGTVMGVAAKYQIGCHQ